MKRLSLFLALLLCFTLPLSAQDLSGHIEGTVTDPQGAVIPGAEVTATHVDTNITYKATTSSVGRFNVPRARLGTYRITVESAGFKRGVVTGVTVEAGGTADVNVKLELGEVTQEVTVSAESAQEIINTTSAELGTTVDQQQVLELPLNGRNAAELAFLQAGTFYEKSSTGEGNKLIVHGQRHRATAFSLDGIDTQDNLNRASSVMVDQPILALSAENVQEFRVVTGISSAEFSRGGSQITAVTRAGSNNYHGSLFWFHRNDFFGANEFFNNASGVERAKRLRNQFGGSVGGPIWRDKAFFFFGYQQTRDVRGIPVNRTVYTQEARMGVFRFLDNVTNTPENVANNPNLIRSIDLMECSANVMALIGRFCVDPRFDSSNPATFDPFIWSSIFDNANPANGIPLPNNFDIGDGLNTGGFRFNAKSNNYEHLPAFRFDYRINEKHLFYGTMNGVDRNIEGDFINGRLPFYPAFGAPGLRLTNSYGFSGALLSNFSPTFINEFRIGRIGGENGFQHVQPFDTPFQLDLNDITDPYTLGDTSARDNVTLHVRDSVTWVRGTHQWRFGGEWRHRSVDNVSLFGTSLFGEIDFGIGDNPPGFSTGESTLRMLARDSSGTVVGATDIETVDFNNAQDQMNNYVGAIGNVEARYNVFDVNSGFGPLGTPERRFYRDRELDLFVQDTWNLRSNLTLNLGLRWEFVTVPIELRKLSLIPEGDQDSVFGISGPDGFFSPGTFSGSSCPELSMIPFTLSTTTGRTLAESFITNCATKNELGGSNNGRPLWDNDFNNFGPVIGVAWDPWGDGKTSIRGGFRLSYIQDVFSIIDGNIDDNEGLTVDNSCIPSNGGCAFNPPAPTLLRDVTSAPIPAMPTFGLPVARTLLDSDAQDFRTYASNLSTSYYTEWTFGIQREIFRNWALEARYVGNQGNKLRRVADFNEININAFDPVSGQTFLESFLIAQQNLACQGGGRFDDAPTATCPNPIPNPLMAALIAADPSRLRGDSAMITALEQNEPGDFIDDYNIDTTSVAFPGSSTSQRLRGGAWWGAVLSGRFPANFFQANPFVASARRMVNDGFSDYHALEIEVRRRTAAGFTFQGNYTFQKGLADFDGDENTLLNDIRPSSVIDTRYTKGEIVPRHQVSVNWLYELPFGKGKRFDSENSLLRRMIGGWQFGGIIQWRSGRPDSIFSGVGTFHRAAVSGANRVNLTQSVGIGQVRKLVRKKSPASGGIFWIDPCTSIILNPNSDPSQCFDPKAAPFAGLFGLPNPGELGQIPGNGFIFGPRFFNFDFNLVKRTDVTEQVNVEFRWEVFNAFNNVNFGLPDTNIFSRSFGQITTTVGDRRLMQFALKVNF